MSGKNKTLLFVISTLILFSIAILSVIKMQQNKEIKQFEQKNFLHVQKSFQNISEKYKKYYDGVVKIIFSDTNLKESIRNQNKDQFFNMLAEQYLLFQKENPNMTNMKFYLADNTLFVDMNKAKSANPEKGGVLIQKVHKFHKPVFGAEQTNNNISYKSIHPIFYGEEYLGALEIGINSAYILHDMKNYADVDGAMYVVYKNKTSFELFSNTLKNMSILDEVKRQEDLVMQKITTRLGNKLSAYCFDIKDYKGISIAKFYFFKNTTQEIALFEQNFNQIAMFLAAMILISIVVINIGVSKSLKELQQSFDNLADYTEMIDNNIMIVDTTADGAITGMSNLFCTVSGYTQNELIGKHFKDLRDKDVEEKFYKKMQKELEKEGSWKGEFKNLTKDKKTYWLAVKADAKYQDKKLICYNYIMHDITDAKLKAEMVFIDELTNTYNRKYFNDVYPRMVNNIKRNGGCVNFIVLDVDEFKKYNEIYGSKQGDEALVKIADKLKSSLRRPDDYCFRLGGAEFGVLYRSESEDEGYLYAQVLKKNIEMLRIKHEGNRKYRVLTASLGLVSRAKDRINNEQEIYVLAYEHLTRAKADGRNKVIRALV
jgi:diguanylate cyclase (GGDEF)-like protein/PAS domain S-box-containing protein